ncbi:hypothetical protein RHGRI_010700 [Rhododendron griersonianum]|uniref:Uncharacterized protein n=1 Tax=Rhododendron griersonianum TaxID=479676 RepID=A0AAV6KJM0_9ERIC|nr:hypothetical protein RHGRI_010700 [Rhododendron griersonianum]
MPNADEFQVAGSGHMVAGACPWQPPTVIHGVSRVGSLCQSFLNLRPCLGAAPAALGGHHWDLGVAKKMEQERNMSTVNGEEERNIGIKQKKKRELGGVKTLPFIIGESL